MSTPLLNTTQRKLYGGIFSVIRRSVEVVQYTFLHPQKKSSHSVCILNYVLLILPFGPLQVKTSISLYKAKLMCFPWCQCVVVESVVAFIQQVSGRRTDVAYMLSCTVHTFTGINTCHIPLQNPNQIQRVRNSGHERKGFWLLWVSLPRSLLTVNTVFLQKDHLDK